MRPVEQATLIDRTHKANPFPLYAYLRWAAPMHQVRWPDGRIACLVTQYQHVAAILTDRRFLMHDPSEPRSRLARLSRITNASWSSLEAFDESTQARFCALVRQVLTPARFEALGDRVVSICHRQMSSVREGRQVDLIGEYAVPISIMVTADLLGVPPDDWRRIVRSAVAMFGPEMTAWRTVRSTASQVWFQRYVWRLLRAHKTQQTQDPLGLVSDAEEFGLTEADLGPVIVLLLAASFETAANLIGNGIATLLHHADQLERLRREYGLMDSAVDELARFTSPVEIAVRYATEDVAVDGVEIPSGAIVLAGVASANRDHRQFQDPDLLNLGRFPNPHLSFRIRPLDELAGPLARLVAQLAIGTLLESAEFMFERDPARLRWRSGLSIRGLESLPIWIARWRN